MATLNPRITLTLTPQQYHVLKSISDNSGTPMSRFIGEVIELSMPTLERMADTFSKFKKAQTIQKQSMIEAIDNAQETLEPIVDQVLHQVDHYIKTADLVMEDIGKAATGQKAKSDRKGASASETATRTPAPSTNRGATPLRGKSLKPLVVRDSSDSVKNKKSKKSRMSAS